MDPRLGAKGIKPLIAALKTLALKMKRKSIQFNEANRP